MEINQSKTAEIQVLQIFRNNLTPCKLFFYVKGMFLNAKRKGKREKERFEGDNKERGREEDN